MVLTDNQKIGALLTGFGLFFLFFGTLLFLDRGLLAIGNILFLSGIIWFIGFKKTIAFFFQETKLRGSILFLGGILLVFLGWVHPIFGMAIEIFGFINLFGNFFPVVLAFVRRLPYASTILNLPGIKQLADKIASGSHLPV
eukprot:TRINITY_DN12519_c0_g1_i1.p1 TRINITY_DN12519_c0_g1~~TRINITY_DN12519_c0_g1_i1.p1  ORF type:complete len:141 (-),score=30.74 TRINITY_DN12519_c0_g1_i1:30-452(-)